jgi:CBS domain-containing protein
MKKVQEIMTKDPIVCSPQDSIQQAARLMKEQDVGSLPVVRDQKDRKIVGILTDRDIVISVVADGKDATTIRVDACMTKSDIAVCRAQDDLSKAVELMKSKQVRRIPVVDDQGRCVGIISQADIALEAEREIAKPRAAA